MDAITDLLTQLDWAAFNHWDIIKPILDAVIPDAWSGYQP
jgi:hypothetical protein